MDVEAVRERDCITRFIRSADRCFGPNVLRDQGMRSNRICLFFYTIWTIWIIEAVHHQWMRFVKMLPYMHHLMHQREPEFVNAVVAKSQGDYRPVTVERSCAIRQGFLKITFDNHCDAISMEILSCKDGTVFVS